MNRLIAIPAFALTAATLLTGCESMGNRHYDYRVMKVQHQPNTALDIVTANGSIRALQEDRENVAVEVELFGYDAERLDFATVHADRMGDNTLRVWIEWPGGKRRDGEGAKVEVFLPDTQGVSAKTSNGSVVIMGLAGDALVKTSNGSVHLDKHQGNMDIATSNGAVRVDDSKGDINFVTSNGRILVSNADGLVEGDTSNGNVFVSTADDAAGPIRIRTSNGRVELDLGQAYKGILRVSTTNGRIKTSNLPDARLIESSNHTLELQMGNSDTVSAVKTTNGSVRIHGDAKD
jgi:ligand-binding sensor domain-containing protein